MYSFYFRVIKNLVKSYSFILHTRELEVNGEKL